jgi:hypothetical protein
VECDVLNIREVDLGPKTIDLWFRPAPNAARQNYWIPYDAIREPDWLEHISRKRWATESMLGRLSVALDVVRRPDFEPPLLGGVYVIRSLDSDHWKVGMSGDIRKRIANINAAGPHPVQLVLAIPHQDPRSLESALIAYLENFRTAGEWFRLLPEDFADVYWGVLHVVGNDAIVAGDGFPNQDKASGFTDFEATVMRTNPEMFDARAQNAGVAGVVDL